ncbi:hypothetical protein [Ruegeria lacuscaerulensis]|uniref:hypothetical protein n=1 Tax=Ruegeria lacuscaerulensis TaxID=55218 RepID=UPI001F2B9741|nr:hypothetical protein [Ruegeria lacuscaerulensis]
MTDRASQTARMATGKAGHVREFQIGMLWVDGPLSFLEQLCIKSFLDVGQHVCLYTYGDVANIPEGTERRDACEVLSGENIITHKRTGSPAVHADKFRYRMLAQQPDMIWADTDAYCVKPFTTDNGHFHGHLAPNEINNGVLRLPPDSPTLYDLIDYTENPYRIPPWLPTKFRRELIRDALDGNPKHAGEMLWGVWGPRALTWLLRQNGEAQFSFPSEVLYPVSFKERRVMSRASGDADRFVTDETMSIHFYGRRMRSFIRNRFGGVPHPESMVGRLVEKHGIDPHAAPIMPKAFTGDEGPGDEG